MPSTEDTITLPETLCETQNALPCRGAGETRIFSVDCSALLGDNETITDDWTVKSNDPLMTVTPKSVTAGVVSFEVTGGVNNHQCAIQLTIPTSAGVIRQPVLTLVTEPQGLVSTAPSITIGSEGMPGANGKDGTNGTNGVDGKDGKDGSDASVNSSTVVATTANPAATLGQVIDSALSALQPRKDGTIAAVMRNSDGSGPNNQASTSDLMVNYGVANGSTVVSSDKMPLAILLAVSGYLMSTSFLSWFTKSGNFNSEFQAEDTNSNLYNIMSTLLGTEVIDRSSSTIQQSDAGKVVITMRPKTTITVPSGLTGKFNIFYPRGGAQTTITFPTGLDTVSVTLCPGDSIELVNIPQTSGYAYRIFRGVANATTTLTAAPNASSSGYIGQKYVDSTHCYEYIEDTTVSIGGGRWIRYAIDTTW